MKISEITAFLEYAYDVLNAHYFNSELTKVVITVQSSRRSYGHYTTYDAWADKNVEEDFAEHRARAMRLLQEEAELQEIVQLVGVDSLSHSDRLILEVTRSIREDFLHQNSFHEVDTYTSLHKQYRMLALILKFYDEGLKAVKEKVSINKISKLPVLERIGRAKYIEEANVDKEFDVIESEIVSELADLIAKEAEEE